MDHSNVQATLVGSTPPPPLHVYPPYGGYQKDGMGAGVGASDKATSRANVKCEPSTPIGRGDKDSHYPFMDTDRGYRMDTDYNL